MSRIEYGYGWSDPRMPRFDLWFYEVFVTPDGYQVVKKHLVHQDVVEVLASGLTLETAEGFIKLLKE
jgi:hypothetical protein